jgi:hypothetical protein
MHTRDKIRPPLVRSMTESVADGNIAGAVVGYALMLFADRFNLGCEQEPSRTTQSLIFWYIRYPRGLCSTAGETRTGMEFYPRPENKRQIR